MAAGATSGAKQVSLVQLNKKATALLEVRRSKVPASSFSTGIRRKVAATGTTNCEKEEPITSHGMLEDKENVSDQMLSQTSPSLCHRMITNSCCSQDDRRIYLLQMLMLAVVGCLPEQTLNKYPSVWQPQGQCQLLVLLASNWGLSITARQSRLPTNTPVRIMWRLCVLKKGHLCAQFWVTW